MKNKLLEERSKSAAIYQKLCDAIPGGVNSPVRSFRELDMLPLIVESGIGAVIEDVDGCRYIDFCGSWGALIHGHAHTAIVEAAQKRVALGSTFGITTAIEEKLAHKIKSLMPSIGKVRFVSTGTEATMSAVRLARAYTGRNTILKFSGNYHGHSDAFLMQAGSGVFRLNSVSSSAGVPQEYVKHTLSLPFNDCESFERVFTDLKDQIACVIMEPVAANMGLVPATSEFINLIREQTHKQGAVLIFDEVITGFRLGLTGAQGLFNVQPDLTCLGKIIGGGFPTAAFGGREEIMNLLAPLGPVYQAGTLSGNPVAMEAGFQALSLLEAPQFYETLEQKTRFLTDPIKKYLEEHKCNACLQQLGSLFTLFFGQRGVSNHEEAKRLNLKLFAHFFRTLFNKGIYLSPSQYEANFVSSAHTLTHLEYTRDEILSFLETHLLLE